jgi:hypothetical protein
MNTQTVASQSGVPALWSTGTQTGGSGEIGGAPCALVIASDAEAVLAESAACLPESSAIVSGILLSSVENVTQIASS